MTEARTLHARTHASCISREREIAAIRSSVERALRRRGWHHDEVDDLVQETCVQLLLQDAFWKMPGRDRERYAIRVSLGLAANQVRGSGRRARREARWLLSGVDARGSVEQDAEELEQKACVYVAMLRLSDDLFALARDRYFRALSLEAIARAHGLKLGTIKSRLRSVRRELVRNLDPEPTREELLRALRALTAPELVESDLRVAKAQTRLQGIVNATLGRAGGERRNPAAR